MTSFEFSTSTVMESWRCIGCSTEVAIVNVMRFVDSIQYSLWGNPDRPPFCPHCGERGLMTRDEPIGGGSKEE